MSCSACKRFISASKRKQCSECKDLYCSKRCFVGDKTHRCLHNHHGGQVIQNFASKARRNSKKFKLVSETPEIQLAYASLNAGESIEKEVHVGVTQVIRVEEGAGSIIFYEESLNRVSAVGVGAVVIIPGSLPHEVRADKGVQLKISASYAPPTTHF